MTRRQIPESHTFIGFMQEVLPNMFINVNQRNRIHRVAKEPQYFANKGRRDERVRHARPLGIDDGDDDPRVKVRQIARRLAERQHDRTRGHRLPLVEALGDHAAATAAVRARLPTRPPVEVPNGAHRDHVQDDGDDELEDMPPR